MCCGGWCQQLLSWMLPLLGGSTLGTWCSWRSLCVFFSCTVWSSWFLNRHAEGLQQLQQLLPEEMNPMGQDGSRSRAPLIAHSIILVLGDVVWSNFDWHGVGLLLAVVACCLLRHDVHDRPPSLVCPVLSVTWCCIVFFCAITGSSSSSGAFRKCKNLFKGAICENFSSKCSNIN